MIANGATSSMRGLPIEELEGCSYTRRWTARRCTALDAYEMSRSLAIHPEGRSLRPRHRAGRCAPTTPRGELLWRQARCPASSGRSTSAAMAGSWSRPTATARSAGTAWTTARSSSPSSRSPTGRTGSPGRPMASTPRRRARTACCAGTSTTAGMRRARPSRSRTSRSCAAPRSCRSCCRRWTSCSALGLAELNEARLATQRRTQQRDQAGHAAARAGGRRRRLQRGEGEAPAPRVRRRRRLGRGVRPVQHAGQPIREGQPAGPAQWRGHPRRHLPRPRHHLRRRCSRMTSRSSTFPAMERWSAAALYLLPHEVDARDPVGIEVERDRDRRARRQSCCSLAETRPGAGAAGCLSLGGGHRRRRQHRGRCEPAAHRTGGGQRDRAHLVERTRRTRSSTRSGRTGHSPRSFSRRSVKTPTATGTAWSA